MTTGIAYTPCGLKANTSTNIGDTTLFDSFGRPTLITHQGGTRQIFAYLDDSHLRITDEDNYVQHHYFLWFGRPEDSKLSKVVDALNQGTEYFYNILGSMIQAQGNGRIDSYSYDSKNFLTGETHPESGTTTYTRDSVGNVKTVLDSQGLRTSQYDAINRLFPGVPGTGYGILPSRIRSSPAQSGETAYWSFSLRSLKSHSQVVIWSWYDLLFGVVV